MNTIKNESVYSQTIEIKKSKFICHVKQVNSKQELDNFLKDFSSADAKHNCYAYKIGVVNIFGGYSDDGEPKGTAGKPIFNVIEKNNLTNVCIIVTRYFGGIKLGAGPLTRAYTSSAANILKIAVIDTVKEWNILRIKFNIKNKKEIEQFLNKNNVEILEKNFSNLNCLFEINAKDSQIIEIKHMLI
ncbi:proline dipeptidase [Mesoplasma chauliocola]|uniref:Proline dipeptidase n=1 Tax=Mesoplasma chauliocola TaxID=216427 RepID=A0A249SMJ4_9MOLU|nr:YigZ family protein [Mesoplasma chauliocola]ASZ08817.1 proline dipeptidase [Mesoplasma chauliocola]